MICLFVNIALTIWGIYTTCRDIWRWIKLQRSLHKLKVLTINKSPEWRYQIRIKRYANRWMDRTLGRPLTGWPRISPVTADDRLLLRFVVERYLPDHPDKASMLLRIDRDNFISTIASIVRHALPPDVDHFQIFEDVASRRLELIKEASHPVSVTRYVRMRMGFEPMIPNAVPQLLAEPEQVVPDLAEVEESVFQTNYFHRKATLARSNTLRLSLQVSRQVSRQPSSTTASRAASRAGRLSAVFARKLVVRVDSSYADSLHGPQTARAAEDTPQTQGEKRSSASVSFAAIAKKVIKNNNERPGVSFLMDKASSQVSGWRTALDSEHGVGTPGFRNGTPGSIAQASFALSSRKSFLNAMLLKRNETLALDRAGEGTRFSNAGRSSGGFPALEPSPLNSARSLSGPGSGPKGPPIMLTPQEALDSTAKLPSRKFQSKERKSSIRRSGYQFNPADLLNDSTTADADDADDADEPDTQADDVDSCLDIDATQLHAPSVAATARSSMDLSQFSRTPSPSDFPSDFITPRPSDLHHKRGSPIDMGSVPQALARSKGPSADYSGAVSSVKPRSVPSAQLGAKTPGRFSLAHLVNMQVASQRDATPAAGGTSTSTKGV